MLNKSFYRTGFTLIELMVTVSVVALLGVIATSSYQTVMAKGDRATAVSDVIEITQALERYFSFNRTYSNNFADIAMANSASFTITDSSLLYNYYIAIPGNTAINSVPQGAKNGLSYTIYAKPTASNRDNWSLAIDQLGFKSRYASGSTTKVDGWP